MGYKYRLVLATLIILFIITVPTVASTITTNNTVITSPDVIDLIGGGSSLPVAYLGEYVDLSKVIGWKGQLAFWYGDPSAAKAPDIVIDATSFQHKFWIDPAKFKVGIWYKWDGTWEGAGNNEAFEIKNGVRPKAVPTEPTSYQNGTKITPVITQVPNVPAVVHIVIARGDEMEYSYPYPDGMKNGYVWLFGKSKSVLGDKMEPTDDRKVFKYPLREEVTQSLEPGWYTGYLQFCKVRPDVTYNQTERVLDTPYDDAFVPDVDISAFTPDLIKDRFELLEKNAEYSNDLLVPITMEVIDPMIQFTDYYESDDNIIISGKSSLSSGTNISFIIDPSHYVKGYSITSHTVITTLTGDINLPRQFTVTLPVDWDEMSTSQSHSVVATVEKLKIRLVQTKEFDITSVWVNPTPTQITEKVIIDSGGWHRVNITQPTTAQPQVIYVNATPQIIYVYVTDTATSNQTIAITTTASKPSPTETESPISPIIAVSALIICAYIVLRKP